MRHAPPAAALALLVAASVSAVTLPACVRLPDGSDNPFNVPAGCFNDVLDGNESDVDCGGSCGPCSSGQMCRTAADCADPNCTFGRCTPSGSTCFDRAKDGDETDVDCGGSCARCGAGKACQKGGDCESGSCAGGVCGAGSGPFSFAPARFALSGEGTVALAVRDLDGDGKLDVAAADDRAATVTVFGGLGDGSLREGKPFAVQKSPRWIGIADLTEDGRPDLVVLARDGSGFQLLENRGGLDFGGTARVVSGPLTNRPVAAAFGDLDGDGHPDVVLTAGSGSVLLFRNLGGGRFDAGTTVGAPGIGPSEVRISDVTGDGKPELAVVADMLVMVLSPDGSAAQKDTVTGTSPWNLELAPLVDGQAGPQGKRDLVVSSYRGEIAVMAANGDGTFGNPTRYLTGAEPYSMVTADFDGDGHVDIATCNQGTSDLSFFAGRGDGTFDNAINRWIGGTPQRMVGADMNGDGRTDLVLCDFWQHDVGVLLNLAR